MALLLPFKDVYLVQKFLDSTLTFSVKAAVSDVTGALLRGYAVTAAMEPLEALPIKDKEQSNGTQCQAMQRDAKLNGLLHITACI